MQSELVFYCDAAVPLLGTTPSNPWQYPGMALSASSKRIYPSDCDIEMAQFILVWNPNALAGQGFNGVRLMVGDDGPSNLEQIAYIGRENTQSPVVNSYNITAAIRTIIQSGASRQILMQTAGQTVSKIYRASVDIVWKLP